MAVTSQSAVGGTGGRHPTLVEMKLISACPTPMPEWENAKKTECPTCKMPCWTHDAIKRAQQDTTTLAVCTGCLAVERDKQGRL